MSDRRPLQELLRKRLVRAALLGFSAPLVVTAVACSGDLSKPFQRWSPEVDKALVEMDSGKADAASARLGSYLAATGCDAGVVVAPNAADAAPAGFDLGLSLFALAESFGKPFGAYVPPGDAGSSGAAEPDRVARKAQVDCARALLDEALKGTLAPDLEARARYLRGNLAYLDGRWDDAVADYDRALQIIPGLLGDAGDGIGRDAAWNRALALRNKEEDDKQDAGADGGKDAAPDGGDDGGNDAGDDAGKDAGDDAGKDAADDAGDDAGKDGGPDAGPDGGDDAGPDGGKDAGPDGGPDGGQDGGPDGGKDGGPDGGNDGGADAGPDGGDAGRDAGDKDGGDGKDGGQDAGQDGGQGDGGSKGPQPPPAGTANQDDRMLDQFEGAPTFQKEAAKLHRGRRSPGMPDK